MQGAAADNIRMLAALCGAAGLPNLSLVTTKRSRLWDGAERGQARLKSLRERFWSDLIRDGASTWEHDGSRDSAVKIVDALRHKEKKPLAIQERMVDKEAEVGPDRCRTDWASTAARRRGKTPIAGPAA
ncbi:uncharacterized protein THITE_2092438 [Thermothielavioides terrestris NRRL 8126]|jgi:hypothetical protein|uniref:Uncharacterized protein n=1 Tax=Thermothielavioides terrestris (strain ATCC 38088 / NRRL 8126) TaxID=578455 RepID=G2REA4_THETT|nr:uncharacterized protein THITE_2092438 [Thermothielavioides terrestris NRRL 8126]AEO70933.1 hypothetical protein THITE_2092438 [Thermothielavioides terrestris NRRL 8126]